MASHVAWKLGEVQLIDRSTLTLLKQTWENLKTLPSAPVVEAGNFS